MKKLLIFICTLTFSLSTATAQDSLWAKAKSDTRFYTNQVIDVSDVDSITFLTARIRFMTDGKARSQAFNDIEYFSFRNPGLTLYCPGELCSNDWNSEASEWCFQRSQESDHFILFWHAGFGLDPTKAPRSYAFNPKKMLEEAEKIYRVNTQELGFSRPGNSYTLDHYKHMLFVRYQTEWLATGSGYDDKVGAFWCNPAAVNDVTTLGHELGHTFQYIVRCDLGSGHGWRQGLGANGEGGNMYWESCAQWQSSRVYPQMLFSGWGTSYPYSSHKNLLHEEPRYENYFHQYYWCQLHGNDFIGRLWMAAKGLEDPVEVYQRLTGRSQAEFCDDMFEYARRCPTWDIDGIREHAANQQDNFTTAMHDTEDGWLEPDAANCPENYGFNVLRMKLPQEPGATVTAHFRGEAGKSVFRSLNTQWAGWRYGFAALTKDGQRVYSDIGRDDQGQLSFTLPADATNLWFVTLGAPTQHFHHAWDDNDNNDEQWPYAVRFEGTDMQGHITYDPTATPHDTIVVINLNREYNEGKELSDYIDLDISSVCQALVCPAEALKLTPASQDTIRVFTEDADGTLRDWYTSQYSNYFLYDAEGNTINPATTETAEADARFYTIYSAYSNRYLLYFGEVNGQTLHAGDTHTFPIVFQRTLSDGSTATARIRLKVTMR